MATDPFKEAERILTPRDYESLEEKVDKQGKAIIALGQAMRDVVREVDRQLKDLHQGRRRGL